MTITVLMTYLAASCQPVTPQHFNAAGEQ